MSVPGSFDHASYTNQIAHAASPPTLAKKRKDGAPPVGTVQARIVQGGPPAQARFYDFNVWTTKKRVEKLRYMHRNPVKRGLASVPEEWRWISYRFYLLDETGPVRVNQDWAKISFRDRAA